jgi:hypothetical protein
MMESNRDIVTGGDDGLEKELQSVEEEITYKMHTNASILISRYIISLSCSYMFRQLCAILRELVCTFRVTCHFWFWLIK